MASLQQVAVPPSYTSSLLTKCTLLHGSCKSNRADLALLPVQATNTSTSMVCARFTGVSCLDRGLLQRALARVLPDSRTPPPIVEACHAGRYQQQDFSMGLGEVPHADGWNKKTRGAEGPMEVNSTRFPSGIPALADWLHGKGDFDLTPQGLGANPECNLMRFRVLLVTG